MLLSRRELYVTFLDVVLLSRRESYVTFLDFVLFSRREELPVIFLEFVLLSRRELYCHLCRFRVVKQRAVGHPSRSSICTSAPPESALWSGVKRVNFPR